MKRSEKLLLVLLASAVGVLFVIPQIWNMFRGPVAEEEEKVARAQKALEAAETDFEASRARIVRMKELKEQSLSANSSLGALAYQQWLSDLAEIVAKWGETQITPDRVTPSRDNSYVSIRIRVSGTGTIEQLQEFLYRFHRARVLHRVASLTVDAVDQSSSKLSFRLTAEALSLRDAGQKGRTLFPRSELATTADKSTIQLISAEGFPKETPFEVRINGSYFQVVARDQDLLTLVVPEGEKLAAEKGATVELSPLHPEFSTTTPNEFAALLKLNPFRKPVPYKPVLNLIGDKTIPRGGTLEATLQATGFDTSTGTPQFQLLGDPPAGLVLDAAKVKWQPAADAKAGDVTFRVRATAAGLREPLESSFTLTLKDTNQPPRIQPPIELTGTIGQPLVFKVTASDLETAPDKLKFSFGPGKPEGASINEATGEVSWTPDDKTKAGSTMIAVVVSDDGNPPQSSTAMVAVVVDDNKAQFTRLTGAVASDGDRQAWLFDRSSNRRFILREGDPFDYAGFNATIKQVGKDFILLQQRQGIWRLDIGQDLKNARMVGAVEPGAIDGRPVAPPLPERREAVPAATIGQSPAAGGSTPASPGVALSPGLPVAPGSIGSNPSAIPGNVPPAIPAKTPTQNPLAPASPANPVQMP